MPISYARQSRAKTSRDIRILTDRIGIGEPDETDDTIHNGALDNGVAIAQALTVASADITPTWYPGDEFEAVRKAAMVELSAKDP